LQGKKDSSFLKKRSKKLLTIRAGLAGSVRKRRKVFWVFFLKKNSFVSSASSRRLGHGRRTSQEAKCSDQNPNDLHGRHSAAIGMLILAEGCKYA
jgi:hypothetical protein